jgi:hypothetical protein
VKLPRPKLRSPRRSAEEAPPSEPEQEEWRPRGARQPPPEPPAADSGSAQREPFDPEGPEAPSSSPAADFQARAAESLKAAGSWLHDTGQAAGRTARAGGESLAEHWAHLSPDTRIRAGAVAGVLLLYLVIKFIPVPGVPCGVSAVKECAPGDDAIGFAPADALIYAHVTLEGDSEQSERAGDAFAELGQLDRLVVGSAAAAVPAPSGVRVDLRADVLPWAEDDLAIASVPQRRGGSATAVIVGVADRAGADEFLAKIAPKGRRNGFAAAFSGEELVFGDALAVRRALDAEAGKVASLDEGSAAPVRDELPEARFADVYLSRDGVRRLLAGRTGPAAQLDTFVDYAATSGMAAAAVAEEDGIEVDLVSTLDPGLAEKSPSLFAELPDFEPDLAGEIGERAIGYVGVGKAGPTLTELLARRGGEAAGLAASLQGLAARLEREAGVNPLRDLLPALGGQAALVAEPTDAVPFASLIVDGVDEDAASEALARLQGPLLRSIGISGRRVPTFEETEVDGVTVSSVQLGATVNLSYATFDGMLVISTDPAGVASVRSGGASLADASSYETATERLPDEVSALVFLNLDELFAQVTRTGLVEDPSFADLTVLFENAASLGLAVQGEDSSIRSELFLALD